MSTECCLDVLDAALDVVFDESLSTFGAVVLAERARRLEILASRLDAARALTLAAANAAVEAPGAMRDLGYRGPEQYVTDRAHVDGRSVRAVSRLGRWLVDFPVLAGAFEAGAVAACHLHAIRRLDSVRTRFALVGDQQFFIDTAGSVDFKDFGRVLAYWSNAADPDGAEPRDQVAKTGLWYRRHGDGAVSGRFYYDPLNAQVFANAVETESQRLFRADAEACSQRHASYRDAESLINLVVKGAGTCGSAAVTPLINIVMSQPVAERLLQQIDDPGVGPVEVRYDDLDGRCEFLDGTPLHPTFALAALAAARLRRVVLDTRSKPVDTSVTARSFPPWMKHLLLIEARGRCRAPGCDAPFPWLQADHITPHATGGQTKLSNGQVLCDPHNKWKGARV